MLPQPTLSELLLDTNTVPESDPSLADISDLSLTAALRISISGETMELGSDLTSAGDPFDPPSKEESLSLPDDIPVDLRVKLAIAMIYLGKELPEVRVRL